METEESIEIARSLINKGYNACGVYYDVKNKSASHFIVDNIEDYEKSIGSKYLQSYTPNGFLELNRNKKSVVFGSPCQIDSLRRYFKLKKQEDKYILVDFFCHGIPSYYLWYKYIDYLSSKVDINDNTKFSWRDKKNGWHSFTFKVANSDKTYYSRLNSNNFFLNLFLGNFCLNECCYSCKFRLDKSSADIRIGDLWGKKYSNNPDGVSGILVLTKKGLNIINDLNENCTIQPEDLSIVWEGQMKKSYPIPAIRTKLISKLKGNKSLNIIYFCCAYKMWIKNLIPGSIKLILKKLIKH